MTCSLKVSRQVSLSGLPFTWDRRVFVRQDEGQAGNLLCGGKNCPKKEEAGRPASGVEGLPETGCPLDPEPGLGGIFSLGLLCGIASTFFEPNSVSVTAVTGVCPISLICVDLRVCP
jgi:hypothetical protein